MPTNVRMVKETPRIIGKEVMVAFVTEGPTDSVTCQLGDYTVVEECESIHQKIFLSLTDFQY